MKNYLLSAMLVLMVAGTCSAAIVTFNVDVAFNNVSTNNPAGATFNVTAPNLPNFISVEAQLLSGSLSSSAFVTNNDPTNATDTTFVLNGFRFSVINIGPSLPNSGFFNAPDRNEAINNVGPGATANYPLLVTPVAPVPVSIGTSGNSSYNTTNFTFQVDKDANGAVDALNGNFTGGVSTSVSGVVRFVYTYDDGGVVVPEPSSLVLLGLGLAAIGLAGRKFRS